MVQLADITYSHDATVAAIKSYYTFLISLHLPSHAVFWPPADGWPDINPMTFASFNKSAAVINLLRHLPYVQNQNSPETVFHMAGPAECGDYRSPLLIDGMSKGKGDKYRILTEGNWGDDVPAHIVGLTMGGRYNPKFLLDTKLGSIYWMECSEDVWGEDRDATLQDDPEEYAPENEQEWRRDGTAWPVETFFEVLKEQYRKLKFLPVGEHQVIGTVGHEQDEGTAPVVARLKELYREHGWPDLTRFGKEACAAAVKRYLRENYPEWAEM